MADIAQGCHDADGDGILVGIEKSAAEVSVRGSAGGKPCHTLIAVQAKALIDDVLSQLDDHLGADRHLVRLQFLFHAQLLGQQGVDAVSENHAVRVHFLTGGFHADHLPVFHENLIYHNARNDLRAGFLGLFSKPTVKLCTKNRIGCGFRSSGKLCGMISDIQGSVFCHQRDLFLFDDSLDGRNFCKIRNNLLQAVAVKPSARHILRAAVIAALNHKHFFAGSGQHDGCRTSGKTAAHDYGVKSVIAHIVLSSSLLYSLYARHLRPLTSTQAPNMRLFARISESPAPPNSASRSLLPRKSLVDSYSH